MASKTIIPRILEHRLFLQSKIVKIETLIRNHEPLDTIVQDYENLYHQLQHSTKGIVFGLKDPAFGLKSPTWLTHDEIVSFLKGELQEFKNGIDSDIQQLRQLSQ